MTNKELRIWNDLRPFSVGFDNIFNHFNLHLDTQRTVNYPPYNIVEVDTLNWRIELALAGFGKKDINISTAENQLTIESNVKSVMADSVGYKDDEDKPKEDEHMVHKGISKRYFKKSFTLADDVVVNGAELKDGMLTIDLKRLCLRKRNQRQLKLNNNTRGLLDRPLLK